MIKEIRILEVNDFQELKDFCWSGALQTLEAIEEKGKEQELMDLINELIAINEEQAIDGTKLNDFIWFDTDYIEEMLDCELWED